MLKWKKTFLAIMQLVVLLTISANVSATLSVVYPKVSAPYSLIFEEIIEGIDKQFDGKIELKPIKRSDTSESMQVWLANDTPDMLIALGRAGYNLAKMLDKDAPVAIGALPIRPNGISGISLLADPKVLFDALQSLAPNIKRVHVVYSKNSEWLIQLANSQSASIGITLSTAKVDDVKSAVAEYDRLLARIDTSTEAVWLPLDPVTANEQIIIPALLEKSWEQNVVLFSSKPAHAKRGALFSMFPNHFELGKQLAVMIESMYQTKQKKGVKPLQSMKLAVNLRTAAHLGFEYKSRQREQFHVTFPR